jgi:hypothetical protein
MEEQEQEAAAVAPRRRRSPSKDRPASEQWAEGVARARNNKRKGANFELRRVDWHREQGRDAERLRLAGAKDEGDIAIRLPDGRVVVEECKVVGTKTHLRMPMWWGEAVTEAANYARARQLPLERVIPVLVIRRHNSTDMGAAWTIQAAADWWAGR